MILAFLCTEAPSIGEINNNAISEEKEPGGAIFPLDRNVSLANIIRILSYAIWLAFFCNKY